MPSSQQNLLLTMVQVQVLFLLEVIIVAHYYGPRSNSNSKFIKELKLLQQKPQLCGAIKTVEFI